MTIVMSLVLLLSPAPARAAEAQAKTTPPPVGALTVRGYIDLALDRGHYLLRQRFVPTGGVHSARRLSYDDPGTPKRPRGPARALYVFYRGPEEKPRLLGLMWSVDATSRPGEARDFVDKISYYTTISGELLAAEKRHGPRGASVTTILPADDPEAKSGYERERLYQLSALCAHPGYAAACRGQGRL